MVYKLRLFTIIWVLLAFFLLFLLGSILFFNASPAEKRITESITAHYAVQDDGFRRETGLLTGREWVNGNSIEVFRTGEETFGAMLSDIRSAEYSINKETYNYWGEKAGMEFAEALSEAKNRGVETRFLMDFVGSVMASREKFNLMQDNEVEVERWRRPSWYQLARLNHRTHRKLLITDGTTGYIGGMNTADAWLSETEDGGYKDYHFRVTGPATAELQAAFSENWVSARGELLTGPAFYPELSSAGNLPVQVVSSHPRKGHKVARKMLLYAIASAHETIDIGSAYFFPDKPFVEAIAEAAERGVKVRILTPGAETDKQFVRFASYIRMQPLLEAGAKIYEYEPTFYHAKKMIVDQHFVTVGSINFDNRSFRLNDEANINILDTEFATRLTEYFEQDLSSSREWTLEDHNNRPMWQRIYGWMTSTFLGTYL